MLDQKRMVQSIQIESIVWRKHAVERMQQREISRSDVLCVLEKGQQIESYPNDFPLPSGLFVGSLKSKILHVVAAFDDATGFVYIISAYEPDAHHFEKDLRTRRKKI